MHMEIMLNLIQVQFFDSQSLFPGVFALSIETILKNWLPLILKNDLIHTDSALGDSASKWHTDINWVAWPLIAAGISAVNHLLLDASGLFLLMYLSRD